MSEGLKIALTAVFGVAVFTAGQIIQKWFIEPIQEQRKLKGQVVQTIAFYSQIDRVHYPQLVTELKKRAKQLSSDLQASTAVVPFYNLLAFLRIVIKQNAVNEVCIRLMILSIEEEHIALANEKRILDILNVEGIAPVHKPFLDEYNELNRRVY